MDMAWIKLDDKFPRNPKVRACDFETRWLYIAGLCFSGEYLTDGFLRTADVALLVGDLKRPKAAIRQLLKVGLWEKAQGGYRIHDYLEYNPTKEKVLRDRAATKERQRKLRGKPLGNGVTTELYNPSPVHVPIAHADALGEERQDAGNVRTSTENDENFRELPVEQAVRQMWARHHGAKAASGKNAELIAKWAARYPWVFWSQFIPTVAAGKPFAYVVAEPRPGTVPLVEDAFLQWNRQLKAEDRRQRLVLPAKRDAGDDFEAASLPQDDDLSA